MNVDDQNGRNRHQHLTAIIYQHISSPTSVTYVDVTMIQLDLNSSFKNCMKTIKVTFSQKAEEYYRDINDYKGDWPGIKFSSSLQCKFTCNLNVHVTCIIHALFLISFCPLTVPMHTFRQNQVF